MSGVDEGRFIDPEQGSLFGEAAQMRIESPRHPVPAAEDRLPVGRPTRKADATYYGMPVVKAPPWPWYVPAYFYVGGAAGASAVIGAAVQLVGRPDQRDLVLRCRWLASAGTLLGAGLLIVDLGRPLRFLNMLRVFRPTAPLNVGTWFITLTGATSTMSALGRGPLRPIGDAMGLVAGAAGPVMTTYTAVVLSNTVIPVWCQARRTLPPLFAASSMSSATSLLQLVDDDPLLARLGTPAKALLLLGMQAVEWEIGSERVRRPLKRGRSGAMWQAAKVCGALGLAASLWPGRSWRKRAVEGALGTAASILLRAALVQAGKASAQDPLATFESQRAWEPGPNGA